METVEMERHAVPTRCEERDLPAVQHLMSNSTAIQNRLNATRPNRNRNRKGAYLNS